MRDLITSVLNKAPVPYVSRSQVSRLFAEPHGAQAQIRSYASNGTLFGIVNRTSTATAAVGWKLFNSAASGKKEDRTEVTRHHALNVWNNPNPFFTQRRLVETEQQHVDLTGEGWLVVARNPLMRSIPLELWPVRPDRIRPVPSATEFTAGYIYTGPDGQEIPLELDEVLRLVMPDPDNPYRGLGPVQGLLRTLDTARYSEEWNRNFFLNNAEPGGVIEVEERLGDDEFNEFRDRWAEAHQGVNNAHRVAILENGMKWVDRKYTMKDMQFAELAALNDDKLFVAYGVSKSMLGIVTDVNRANADSGKAMFAEYLTVPRLDRIRDMLNFSYLPLFGAAGKGLEFDYDNPVPPDAEAQDRERTSKATAAKTYVDAGFTGKSVVEALELPDSLVWEKPEPPKPPVMAGAQPATGKPPAPAARTSWAPLNTAPPEVNLDQVQADWETALDQLISEWAEVTTLQREQISAQVRHAVNNQDPAALAAITVGSAAGAQLLTLALAEMAATAAAEMAEQAAVQGVAVAPAAVPGDELALVATAVAVMLAAGLATSAGREALRLFAPGASGDEVAAQVDAHLGSLSETFLRDQLGGALSRAQMSGRMNTVLAAPEAALYADEQLDRNTCGPCRKVHGKWLGNSSDMVMVMRSYPNGQYVHCEGGIRCRGQVVPIWRPRRVGDER